MPKNKKKGKNKSVGINTHRVNYSEKLNVDRSGSRAKKSDKGKKNTKVDNRKESMNSIK